MPTVNLPKWPACIVTGKKVSELQAAQIILKTDSMFPESLSLHEEGIYKKITDQYPYITKLSKKSKVGIDDLHCIKPVAIEYLHTSRISCGGWWGGLHGWIDWDGTVLQRNTNIGKHPTVHSVLCEWKHIARTFPFLDLTCTLLESEAKFDSGDIDGDPLIQYRVKNGAVSIKTRNFDEYPDTEPIADKLKFEEEISIEFFMEKFELVYGWKNLTKTLGLRI